LIYLNHYFSACLDLSCGFHYSIWTLSYCSPYLVVIDSPFTEELWVVFLIEGKFLIGCDPLLFFQIKARVVGLVRKKKLIYFLIILIQPLFVCIYLCLYLNQRILLLCFLLMWKFWNWRFFQIQLLIGLLIFVNLQLNQFLDIRELLFLLCDLFQPSGHFFRLNYPHFLHVILDKKLLR